MEAPSPTIPAGGLIPRRQAILICLLLALLTAAAYWPVTKNGFINYDDEDYVTANPHVQAGLTLDSIHWAFTTVFSSNWHPLTWLSHMLDSQVYGLSPLGHHLTNVFFHIANTLLLFLLLKSITSAIWRSALVAALFALHPLHVESVAWIAERKDVLCTFFGLLSMLAYASYARNKLRLKYLLSLALFALGLMSKPMLVTLPFLLLLLDYWPLRRLQLPARSGSGARVTKPARNALTCSLGALLKEKLPFFALSAASCVVTFLAQQAGESVLSFAVCPFATRVANVFVAYSSYLGKAVWPANLAVFYPYLRNLDWFSLQLLVALALLVAISILALANVNRRPYITMGWFWFLGMLVPVIGLVQVGEQAYADRYTYIPLIGLLIMLVWGATELAARMKVWKFALTTAALALLAACAITTAKQAAHWRNDYTLFQHALDVTTRNYLAYTVVANKLFEEGELQRPIEYCKAALEILPAYPGAHNILANIYAKQGNYTEAVEESRAALAVLPRYPEALCSLANSLAKLGRNDEAAASYQKAIQYDPNSVLARTGLASLLITQSKFPEAEAQCRDALRLAPNNLPALFTLATALHGQGKLEEAAASYRRILELDPKLFTPHRYLGNVLLAQNKPDEAVAEYLAALKVRPDDADTHTVLGLVLLDRGRVDEAEVQLREATQLQPTNSMALYQLALIHQSKQELPEAIDGYHKALAIKPDWPDALNNLAWLLASTPNQELRNGPEAVRLAEHACQLTQNREPLLLGTLAAAYAEAGRFKEAVATAEKARDLAIAAGQKEVADKNSQLLELYRAGKPFHESRNR